MAEIICAVICGILALISLMISIMSFMEKGFLFNNAYIWASEQERAKMDKKPPYRQTGVVFALITAIFLCMVIECVFQIDWLWIVTGVITLAALIYAISSSVKETGKR